ncbi:MAG: acetoin utilization protein [Rhodospirillales bacterium]|nr:acetoin utilization protein [Rhodospirillales bacterium]
MATAPLLIGNDIYRSSSYGRQHPLAIPRVSTVIDLVRALGWLDEASYRVSPRATPDQLLRFHDAEYIAALQRAEVEQRVSAETAQRFGIGTHGNPIYPEMFRRPATSCGASLLAADLLLSGRHAVIYSPAGGTHHGRPDRAAGFCYFNDPALAILRLLDGGTRRLLYVDLDAHHCDGVADAFADEERVVVLSVHEEGRWPFSGALEDEGCGNLFNLPVPQDFNDSEMAAIVDRLILPLAAAVAPEVVVVQAGADALAEDPLSRLSLSNAALWRALAAIAKRAPRLLVLGGGGYNPWSVARCWAGNWAVLNGIEMPRVLPPGAEAVLRGLSWSRSAGRNPPEHWFTTLADAPRDGEVRPEILQRLARLTPRVADAASFAEAL